MGGLRDFLCSRRIWLVTGAAVALAGLVMLVEYSQPAVEVRIVESQPAEILDDAGGQMYLATVAMSHGKTLILDTNGTKGEAKVAGRWVDVQTSCCNSSRTNAVQEALLLMPEKADHGRIRVRYTWPSYAWRLGWLLSHCRIKLPPKYWSWAGWPKAEGPNPRWKYTNVEFRFAPKGTSPRKQVATALGGRQTSSPRRKGAGPTKRVPNPAAHVISEVMVITTW